MNSSKTHPSCLLDNSKEFFFVNLSLQGHCTFANECFLQRLGYSATSLIGKSFEHTILEIDRKKYIQMIQDFESHKEKIQAIDIQLLSMNGNMFLSRWEFYHCGGAMKGKEILQGVGYETKISFKEIKLALIKKKTIVKALSVSCKHVKFFVAPDYHILFFSKKAYELALILHQRELKIGDCMLEYTQSVEQGVYHCFKQSFNEALGGKWVVRENEVGLGGEVSFFFESEYQPIYEDGYVIGVVIIITDITEEKKKDRHIKKQAELLRNIAYIQSHKTRQPVSTILGLVSIINKEELSEENKKVLALLETTTKKLDEVIHMTVAYSNSLNSQAE